MKTFLSTIGIGALVFLWNFSKYFDEVQQIKTNNSSNCYFTIFFSITSPIVAYLLSQHYFSTNNLTNNELIQACMLRKLESIVNSKQE